LEQDGGTSRVGPHTSRCGARSGWWPLGTAGCPPILPTRPSCARRPGGTTGPRWSLASGRGRSGSGARCAEEAAGRRSAAPTRACWSPQRPRSRPPRPGPSSPPGSACQSAARATDAGARSTLITVRVASTSTQSEVACRAWGDAFSMRCCARRKRADQNGDNR
jgi:hypothetical protein